MVLATKRETYRDEYGEGHTNMLETAVTCHINKFFEIKVAMKYNTKFMHNVRRCDAMNKDGRSEEMSKFSALSGCVYNNELCFVYIEFKSIVCHPSTYITETVT